MTRKIAGLIALCAMASGLTSARAAETFTAYNLSLAFTNAQASYWSVDGAPQTTGTTFIKVTPNNTSVQTDNSGHISGNGLLTVTYNTAQVPFSTFSVSYSGQITSPAGFTPTATVFIRGPGFTVDGSGQPTTTLNSISLKFVGQPGINPLNNGNQFRIVGQLTGMIRGPTPLTQVGSGTAVLPSLQAVITGSRSNLVALNLDVVQSQNRMQIFANGATGSGTIGITNSFKLNVLGSGSNRGYALLATGVLGSYTNVIGPSNVAFLAPISVELKGKINGQVVSGSVNSNQISAGLIQ